MQKEKILRELYRGRLMLAEKSIVPGSEFQKQQYRLVELEKEIEAMLDEKEKERLHEYLTVQNNLLYSVGEERFIEGFRMGAKLILEIFEKDGEQTKPISG